MTDIVPKKQSAAALSRVASAAQVLFFSKVDEFVPQALAVNLKKIVYGASAAQVAPPQRRQIGQIGKLDEVQDLDTGLIVDG